MDVNKECYSLESLSNGSMCFWNGLNVFLKDFGSLVQQRYRTFTCYSIFMKPADSNLSDTKNVPINFKQDEPS